MIVIKWKFTEKIKKNKKQDNFITRILRTRK